MTWLFTVQVAALALAIGAGAYFYARGLAQAFDKRFGPQNPALPHRAGRSDGRPGEKP
ncbi:hypothetical protein [Methylobacterium sp. J-090]|uniref:hypothetical protein n=1 Tax=Methylobacterium sp. J-090 TaxID=2836666 RepID=UPI001FBB73F2|nr:hypothetical protein [Methylobacterium sp. J-090]MCJ2084374.1 hypothetical protein [Methylobacterium sp. J-090]